MTAHAKISPSSSHRILGCPGSVNLIATLPPQPGSRAANEGTCAHLLLARCISENLEVGDFLGEKIVVEGDEFTVDESMVNGVQMALDVVDKYLDDGFAVLVEQRISLDHICADQFGTGDIVLMNKAKGIIGVLDFKYGYVVDVEVEDNPQLLCYLSGVVAKHNGAWPLSHMFMGIIQPRSGGVKICDVFINELRGFEGAMREAAALALTPDAPLRAGDHCEWCAAAGICPEFRAQSARNAMVIFKELNDSMVTEYPAPAHALTPEQVGRILDEAALIEHWIEAVRMAALHTAVKLGVMPVGWKLVRKNTHRKWIDEEQAAAMLTMLYELGDDQLYTKKLISPAMADKLLGKRAKDTLAKLWRHPPGDPTLAPLSDKRELLVIDPQAPLHELKKALDASVELTAEKKSA